MFLRGQGCEQFVQAGGLILKLKGVLLDEAGQVVSEAVTAGGVSFSEEELDRLDADKLAMLEK